MEKNRFAEKSTIVYLVYIILLIAVIVLSNYAIYYFRSMQSHTFDHSYYIYTLLTYMFFGCFIAADRPLSKKLSKGIKLIIRLLALAFIVVVFILPYFSIFIFGPSVLFVNNVHINIALGYLFGASIIDFISQNENESE